MKRGVRLTTEEFIRRAKEKHGDTYGYELTNYVDHRTPITIICKVHGAIQMLPNTHLQGPGCRQCYLDENVRTAPCDTKSFIKKSRKIHGNKYNYDKVYYINYNTPVKIICPIHGSFWMKPYTHLQPAYQQGCPKCSLEKRVIERTGNLDEFIEKSRKAHGDKYNYDKVVYVNRVTKVIITCPIHGDFEQKPADHIRGIGCPHCGNSHINGRSKDEIIEECQSVHHGRYKYQNLPERANQHDRIEIICTKHGLFKQSIKYHLMGGGCPICSNSKHANLLANELDDLEVEYDREKTFPWLRRCKKGNGLRLDFYLPSFNVAVEYQGAMHFGIHVNNKYTFKQEDYEDLYNRDKAKYNLCKEHGIRVFYFCYNKEYIPEDYIDKVYTTVSELMAAIKEWMQERPL